MKNNQKGITLVALVITIIVLLILAGVTIASLSGDNGILNRGKEAKTKTNIQNAKDLINTEVTEHITEYYNTKYVNQQSVGNMGTYVVNALNNKKGVAASVIDTVNTSGRVVTTNVKNEAGTTLTATFDDLTAKITWNF